MPQLTKCNTFYISGKGNVDFNIKLGRESVIQAYFKGGECNLP